MSVACLQFRFFLFLRASAVLAAGPLVMFALAVLVECFALVARSGECPWVV